jgi:hypothetical protein
MNEPALDDKLWMIGKLADFINETKGQGTFRKMLEYLDMPYQDTYLAGGMTISNALATEDDGVDEYSSLSDDLHETMQRLEEAANSWKPIPIGPDITETYFGNKME